MKKLLLAFLLSLCCVAIHSADGDIFTAQTIEGVDVKYKVISESEKTCQVGSGQSFDTAISTGYTGAVTIPANINGYKVTAIGRYAFEYCRNLTSVTIPNSVMSIGINAFESCSGLTSLAIPNSVTSIDSGAFYGCSGLTSFTIPNSVTSISNCVFQNCSRLKTVTIPNSVTSIDSSAFYGCSSLTSVTIPNSVTSINNSAFSGCSALISITIPNSVTSIGYNAFYDCSGLKSLTIGNSVTSIGEFAFGGCSNLPSVTIPNSVTSIDERAFEGCSSLTSVTIPQSVTNIGKFAFKGCSRLTAVYISDLTAWCKITFGNILSNPLYFANQLYLNGNEVKNLIIPNSVTDIGAYAFNGCSALTSVTIPNSVTSIGVCAFEGCSGLTSITIPNSVTSIGGSAFQYCSGLTSITIPNSVTNIGDYAFYGCSGLTAVHISDLAAWCKISFSTYASNPLIYAHHLFLNGTEVKDLKIPNSVTSINSYAFPRCYGLTSVTIPNSVTNIGDYAFDLCFGLTSITIPNSVTSIGSWAFFDCSGLTSIDIPNSVTDIGLAAFSGCSGLTSIVVDNGNTSYDSREKCNAIIETSTNILTSGCKNTTIPNSVTSIGSFAFAFCSSLTSITIPNSVINIGSQSFKNTSLVSVTIPNSVTFIGDYAFLDCSNMNFVKSEIESPFSISENVFDGISSNATLQIPKGTKSKYQEFGGWTTNFKNIIEEEGTTTYTLSITASGNGNASYNSTTIKNQTKSFTINEGTSATVSFAPDNGYRIANVKVNNTDVTSSVSNNKYTISNISANTTLSVAFEAIPPTTYTLSITASGNGNASDNSTTIKNQTKSFTINEGTSATVSFAPDNGYRIASVKVNNTNVTSSVSNNKYTISNITANTTLSVTFEAIPVTTYTLSITASGNGYVTYNSTSIRSETRLFTVNEGTSATVLFIPDSGYRIASVKVNNTNVTSSVSNNKYTISNITANTTLSVTFEAIPVTTYTLSITASGNGSAMYNSTTVKNQTKSFTLNEGTSATISFTPDSGYRIASVKLNNTDITSSVSNNKYTISNITANTTLAVTFEAIPPTTYTLSITASGNGSATYNSTTIKSKTQSFDVEEGTSATVTFSPDNGYRIASVKVNSTDVTSSVSNNKYTISNITANTTLSVTFEAIPAATYTLSITASGNGSVMYNSTTIRSKTQSFDVDEGTSATVSFTPDSGYRIASVKVNNTDVTSSVTNNKYTISNITANTTIVVAFEEEVTALTVEGVNYSVVSQTEKTVNVVTGNYGQVLTVPATVTQNGKTWAVTGISNDALKDCKELAAVIWNPSAAFTATVNNPNLLLYVKAEEYAPATIKNVVVNGTASSITLTDAASGNSFYCPQAFTARSISYTHRYSMTTGIGESRGWETLALPFDVQSITHETKGDITPFANRKSGDAKKPFWLYELTGSGFVEAASIKAYTPYIISMPNNPQYDSQWLLNGNVTFAASNVTVGKTEDVNTATYRDRTFVPNFVAKGAADGLYALNVNNDYTTNESGMTEGSKFVLNMRTVHPFEAYMTTASNARQVIDVFEDMTTDIKMLGIWEQCGGDDGDVYDLQGRQVSHMTKGVYVGKKGQKYIK